MKVYIAGPFFNEQQLETVQKIEHILLRADIEFFSPRREGILLHMDKADAESMYDHIFRKNVEQLHECDTIVAIIDDRDIGTIWEIGYAAALGKDIITYTAKEYGLNIMLAKCVRFHSKSFIQLESALFAAEIKTESFSNLY